MSPFRSFVSIVAAVPALAFNPPAPAAEESGANSAQPSTGLPVSLGTVDPRRLLATYYKTKEVEQEVADARAAAKKELNQRIALYRKTADGLAELNAEVQSPAASDEVKGAAIQQRNAKAAALQKIETEIREFQQSRQKQVEDQAMHLRAKVLQDVSAAIEKAAKAKPVSLVLDRTGPSLNGIPFVLFAPEAADLTASAGLLLPSRPGAADTGLRTDPGQRSSLERLAIVDVKTALDRYFKTKDAEQRIADATKAAQADVEEHARASRNLAAEIKKLDDDLQNPASSLTEKISKAKDRDAKSAEFEKAKREFQEFELSRKRQLEEQTIRMRSGLAHDVEKVIAEIARESNADLILDGGALGARGLPAVVCSTRLCNVTDETVARVNSTAAPERMPFSPAPTIAFANFNLIFNALPAVREINEEQIKLLAALGADSKGRTAAQDAASQKKAPQLARVLDAVRAVESSQNVDLVLNLGEKGIDGMDFVLRRDAFPDLTNSVLEKLGLPRQRTE